MKLELLRCRAEGDDKEADARPPLLFVHGSFCGAWVWAEHYLPFFAREGWECLAVSLRGHGDSQGRGQLDQFGLDDYVADIAAAAGAAGRPPVVIGHSMGGMVAQRFVAGGGEAAGMVLMSSVPPGGFAGPAAWMAMTRPRITLQLAQLQRAGGLAVDPIVISEAMFSTKHPPESAWRWLPLMQPESQRATWEVMAPLPHLGLPRLPSLVLGGDQDAFIPIQALRATASYHKAELKVLAGAPHALMLDTSWRRSAEAVLDWLWRTYGVVG